MWRSASPLVPGLGHAHHHHTHATTEALVRARGERRGRSAQRNCDVAYVFATSRSPPGIPAESSAALFAPMASSDVCAVETVVPKEEDLDKVDPLTCRRGRCDSG
jgi:hypothetical protein